MRVLVVTSELYSFAKSGGLADMVGALCPALRHRNLDIRIVMPRYGAIPKDRLTYLEHPIGVHVSGERWCAIACSELDDVPVYLIEHDVLFDRPGLYGPPGGAYADNCLRFSVLGHAAWELCNYLNWWPHVIHGHDWQAAMALTLLHRWRGNSRFANIGSVFTIHNLAYQGRFGTDSANLTGLDSSALIDSGMLAFNEINFLRGALCTANVLSTVSPTYAREIQTPAYGEGLHGLLRQRSPDLVGVLNGIDANQWNPASDPWLPAHFSPADLSGKAVCKRHLQEEAGLPLKSNTPLLAMVSRLTEQKGIGLLLAAADSIVQLDAQLVVLGTGDDWAMQAIRKLAERHPNHVHAWLAFDEPLSHRIEAAADLFIMPSLWEPCGLNQMYSQRYGTLPIVRATGGLHDTVENYEPQTGEGTGFKFWDATSAALRNTIAWAVDCYRNHPDHFSAMVQRAMTLDRSWSRAAAMYEYLYRRAHAKRS